MHELVHNLLMQFFTLGSSKIEVSKTYFFYVVTTDNDHPDCRGLWGYVGVCRGLYGSVGVQRDLKWGLCWFVEVCMQELRMEETVLPPLMPKTRTVPLHLDSALQQYTLSKDHLPTSCAVGAAGKVFSVCSRV